MADPHGAPFKQALAKLREQLLTGAIKPGDRLVVAALAGALQSSTTPVREALSRLAGEGLIEERRGLGYFAPSVSSSDIADLYRLSLAHMSLALRPERAGGRDRPRQVADSRGLQPFNEDPVGQVEQLFLGVVRSAGGRILAMSYAKISVQLGPIRRQEPHLFGDLASEAAELQMDLSDRPITNSLSALRRFHHRRIATSAQLASLLECRD